MKTVEIVDDRPEFCDRSMYALRVAINDIVSCCADTEARPHMVMEHLGELHVLSSQLNRHRDSLQEDFKVIFLKKQKEGTDAKPV